MKLVIFGAGITYQENKKNIGSENEIVAFIDNKEELCGKIIDGIRVYLPEQISQLTYDQVILMSAEENAVAMREQLLELGCTPEKIIHYSEYVSRKCVGEMTFWGERDIFNCENRCLIITTPLGYHGGSIAAVYAALEIQKMGWKVVIAAPAGNQKFIDEFCKQGIGFLICPNLKFAKKDELYWAKKFKRIIANTYPMILCALELSEDRDVALWLHESDVVYSRMEYWKSMITDRIKNSRINMYAVSDVARRNFIKNVTTYDIRLLPCGIPDLYKGKTKKEGKLTFALIGSIHPIKQQDIFIKAIQQLEDSERDTSQFLIIGRKEDIEYAEQVDEAAGAISSVQVIGELVREEIEDLYFSIDVFVIPSIQETMSLVATEAMMLGKVCIVSAVAGMADFVIHEKNGLICKVDNVMSLTEQLRYCIQNRDQLENMGRSARQTYEDHFKPEIFRDKISRLMIEGLSEAIEGM